MTHDPFTFMLAYSLNSFYLHVCFVSYGCLAAVPLGEKRSCARPKKVLVFFKGAVLALLHEGSTWVYRVIQGGYGR